MDQGGWERRAAVIWASLQPHTKQRLTPDQFNPYRAGRRRRGTPITVATIGCLKAFL